MIVKISVCLAVSSLTLPLIFEVLELSNVTPIRYKSVSFLMAHGIIDTHFTTTRVLLFCEKLAAPL